MAVSNKVLNDKLRECYIQKLIEKFAEEEEVLRVGSSEISFPVVDGAGNEKFVVLSVKVPTGSRDGDEYDGYSMAQEYEMKCAEKAEKAKAAAEAKAKKMARDAKARAKKAEAKAAAEAAE